MPQKNEETHINNNAGEKNFLLPSGFLGEKGSMRKTSLGKGTT
jgi:hypothetical protein